MIYDLDDDCVIFKADKIDVAVYFKNGAPWYVTLDDDEYETEDSKLQGLYVYYGARFVPIYNLLINAICEYASLKAEAEQEAEDNYNMIQEIMSPFKTGRL